MSRLEMVAGDLAQPGRARGARIDPWLTEHEYRLLATLVSLIIPSDELGPGAEEADVATRLEVRLTLSSERQALYRSGLRSFERLTHRLCKQSLSDLPRPLQQAILKAIEQAHRKRHAGGAALQDRVKRKLRSWLYAWRGDIDAVVLFPDLVAEVLELFYCSPVAWEWLGYDGPPVSRGWYLHQ